MLAESRAIRVTPELEPLKILLVLTNVDADGNESLGDELLHPRIRIHLGIQPSTARSDGSAGEI
jgi:hypothetical protein